VLIRSETGRQYPHQVRRAEKVQNHKATADQDNKITELTDEVPYFLFISLDHIFGIYRNDTQKKGFSILQKQGHWDQLGEKQHIGYLARTKLVGDFNNDEEA